MYPFKKAHLNDCGGDITKRWYIVFYSFDVQQQKLVRKRFYEVNDYPTEIDRRNYARLMIREINQLLEARKIFIPGSVSKNGKDGYVSIPESFYKLLKGSEVFNFGNRFMFHARHEDKPFSKNVMTERFRKLIKPLNLDPDYTLYSWKHSGVVAAYYAGVDIKGIQNQCHHHSLEQTDVYLKSLGLGVSQAINNIPDL